MRMPAYVFDEPEWEVVVLGPCPGCESWQLDYTREVASGFYEAVVDDLYEIGFEGPVASVQHWDSSLFREVVEDLLQEHLAECPHLQLLLDQGL